MGEEEVLVSPTCSLSLQSVETHVKQCFTVTLFVISGYKASINHVITGQSFFISLLLT